MEIKKIAYRAGHNELAPGAVGILKETVVNREVLPHFGGYLKSLGYETLDVTPPYGMNRSDDLAYGVNKANAWGADLFISLHANKAYEKYLGAIGSEVCAYSGNNPYAIDVAKALYNLGFTDDEGKQRRKSTNGLNINPSLYELKHTNMPAMIVEMFFVEATKDVELYQKLGPQIIAKAIAESIEGKKVQSSPQPTPAPSPNKPNIVWDDSVRGKIGTVTASELNVRYTADGEIIGTLKRGSKVRLWRLEGDWYHINSPFDGYNQAYVHKNYISIDNSSPQVTAPNKKYGIVTAKAGLNVRKGAGTNYPVVGVLKYRERVQLDVKVGKWWSTYYGAHGGFVSADYIREE